MGNSVNSSTGNPHPVIQETDEEPQHNFTLDNSGYTIRSLVKSKHNTESLGRPVVVFDRWSILCNNIQEPGDIHSKSSETLISHVPIEHNPITHNPTAHNPLSNENSDIEESTSSSEQLNTCTSIHSNTHSQSNHLVKTCMKRPNSLALLISHTHIEEVSVSGSRLSLATTRSLDQPLSNGLKLSNRTHSADTILENRPKRTNGLQQRRNQRPTSLMIPSLQDLRAPPQTTGKPCQSNFFNHNQGFNPPPLQRERSHSMPSSALLDMKPERKTNYTLDEALSLLNKKKMTKQEVESESLLHKAAEAGHVKLMKKCLTLGCDVNKALDTLLGVTSLHCAARANRNSEKITKMLLEAGVDVNSKNKLGETAIFSAIIHHNMDCAHILIENGAHVNTVWQDSTPLYLVLSNKKADTCRKLLQEGANVTQIPRGACQQPLHAVLDLIHNHPVDYKTVELLELTVQADGQVVKHLKSYHSKQPGQSQELIYRIFRMNKGPVRERAKRIIMSLIQLGYKPSRNELTTMNELSSDSNYDYLYNYVKAGIPPLKDLCVRAIREECVPNVSYCVKNWTSKTLTKEEKQQILLEPKDLPNHDYENIVLRSDNTKESRKSKRKSLKSFVGGLSKLSRRMSKKNHHKDDSADHKKVTRPLLSLPPTELSRVKSGSLPVGIDQAHKATTGKHKFVKQRDSKRKSSTWQAVEDIVQRYSGQSDGEHSSGPSRASSEQHLHPSMPGVEKLSLDNVGYELDDDSAPHRVSARIDVDPQEVAMHSANEDVEVKFHETSPLIRSVNDHVQTPSRITNPLTNNLTVSGHIEIGGDY